MASFEVLYDHQAFEMQRYGGISRYFYELITHLQAKPELAIRFFTNEYLHQGDASLRRGARFIPERPYKWFKGHIKKANKAYAIQRLQQSAAPIFHATYHQPYFFPHLGDKKYVLTVHDMNYELMPERFPKAQAVIEMKRQTIARADRIIAISQNTKDDLIRLLNVDPNKIDVVYHGVRALDMSHYQTKLKLPKRYILFVGDRGVYKNFSQLYKAFVQIAQQDPDLQLICTGKPFHKRDLKQFAADGLRERIHLYRVSDYDLATLYQRALFFVFPSLYEGFGLPILEAFSYHCPALLSNRSCFPEIAGDAALYFDPDHLHTLVEAMQRLLHDEALRSDLVRNGSEQVKQFTWEETAKQTLQTYQMLLQ